MTRNIDAPGIEYNEIDRSHYNTKTDHSLPNAPICLICGFSSIGPNYQVQWIDKKNTFFDVYGYPTTEPEKYFYNAVVEVLNRGGIAVTAKLPYDNMSLNKYAYVDYFLEGTHIISSQSDVYSQITNKYNNLISSFNVLSNFEQNYTSFFLRDAIISACNCITQLSVRNILLSAQQYYDKQIETKQAEDIRFRKAGSNSHTFNNLFNYSLSTVINRYDADDIKYTNEYIQLSSSPDLSHYIFNDNWAAYKLDLSSINNQTKITNKYFSDTSSTYSVSQLSNYLCVEYHDSFNDSYEEFSRDKNFLEEESAYVEMSCIDPSLTSYAQISASSLYDNDGKPIDHTITLEQLDNLLLNAKQLEPGKIRFVDISHSKYSKVECDENSSQVVNEVECLGLIPVITSPMNALFYQGLIQAKNKTIDSVEYTTNIKNYNLFSQMNYCSAFNDEVNSSHIQYNSIISSFSMPLSAQSIYSYSLSKQIAQKFPLIQYKSQNHLYKTNLKKIGVVLLEAFKDQANNGKIGFNVIESYVGSLDRNAVDENTNKNIFIDNIVNQNSDKIRMFSNVRIDDKIPTILIKNQPIMSLGFNTYETSKNISINTSILDALNIIFKKNNNTNTLPLDIVIDAGVSNIAQYIYNSSLFDPPEEYVWKIDDYGGNNDIWRSVHCKYDEFCKNVRHDCMFLADGLRPFCLIGNNKIVRSTDITSTVNDNILPNLKYMIGINSSFTAGYCNWFYQEDDYTKDLIWLPPSIKAAGIMIYCDTYFHTWSAPAGINRGKISNIYDCAFSPTIEEAGKIYNSRWNYAISYPIYGIVMEGQKTMQQDLTALDRINVRRLLLYLEKRVIINSRKFLYEGNTPYLRQRFLDSLQPIFEKCKLGAGISDYAIKCDEELNTPEVIERNEMRCRIAIKPIKVLEYLVLDFIVTNQSANVNEEVIK